MGNYITKSKFNKNARLEIPCSCSIEAESESLFFFFFLILILPFGDREEQKMGRKDFVSSIVLMT